MNTLSAIEAKPELDTSFKWTIYALCEKDGNVRYVGITKVGVKQRLKSHMKCSRRRDRNTYRDNWIRSLGYEPTIYEIEGTNDSSKESFWINFFKEVGCKMTNLTNGGDGISGYRHTDETRMKMSLFHKGRPKPESSRGNYSRASKKTWADPDKRKKLSIALMGHKVSGDVRIKIGEARRKLIKSGWVHPCTGKPHSEARKKKNSDSQKNRYQNGVVSPRLGFIVSDETRERLREAGKKRYANGASSPTKGMKFNPEVRARMSAAAKLRELNKTK